MSWTWLIAPVLGILAAYFGWDARRSRQERGRAEERNAELQRRADTADKLADLAAAPDPDIERLRRVALKHIARS